MLRKRLQGHCHVGNFYLSSSQFAVGSPSQLVRSGLCFAIVVISSSISLKNCLGSFNASESTLLHRQGNQNCPTLPKTRAP